MLTPFLTPPFPPCRYPMLLYTSLCNSHSIQSCSHCIPKYIRSAWPVPMACSAGICKPLAYGHWFLLFLCTFARLKTVNCFNPSGIEESVTAVWVCLVEGFIHLIIFLTYFFLTEQSCVSSCMIYLVIRFVTRKD